jgi:hypothetical protein
MISGSLQSMFVIFFFFLQDIGSAGKFYPPFPGNNFTKSIWFESSCSMQTDRRTEMTKLIFEFHISFPVSAKGKKLINL